MFLIVSKYLIPKGYSGLAVFPFAGVQYQEDRTNISLINHEKIHLRQQLELLIIPLFLGIC